MDFINIIAQAQTDPQGGGGRFLFVMLLMFAGMWFLIIAPQRKRQKLHDAMVKGLKTGDHIVIAGGIFGEITNVKEDRIVVKIADNTKVEVGRAFVHSKIETGN